MGGRMELVRLCASGEASEAPSVLLPTAPRGEVTDMDIPEAERLEAWRLPLCVKAEGESCRRERRLSHQSLKQSRRSCGRSGAGERKPPPREADIIPVPGEMGESAEGLKNMLGDCVTCDRRGGGDVTPPASAAGVSGAKLRAAHAPQGAGMRTARAHRPPALRPRAFSVRAAPARWALRTMV
jgi:hypothetical protein